MLSGCAEQSKPTAETADEAVGAATQTLHVTDLLDRTVELPGTVEKIVAVGPGALRLVCYAGAADQVVGIEDIEVKKPVQRPYLLANPSLLELPIIGAGGPDSSPDAERILEVAPDVIFTAQIMDRASADDLQATTGIPVVAVNYGDLGTFGEQLFTSIDLVGEVIGATERTTELVALIRSTMADLGSRTSSVAESDHPSAYVGGLGFKGAHGIESTSPNYPPFSVISAKNIAADLTPKGSVMIDKEQLLQWDPDFIFLDRSGIGLVREDVSKNRSLYEGLTAVKQKRTYSQIPFNNYWTNVETALGNAYYAGAVMYPEQFSDIDPAAKFDEISTAMLGSPMYDALSETYKGGFDSLDLLAK
jgi:iron complex transport system substrate-binding protein